MSERGASFHATPAPGPDGSEEGNPRVSGTCGSRKSPPKAAVFRSISAADRAAREYYICRRHRWNYELRTINGLPKLGFQPRARARQSDRSALVRSLAPFRQLSAERCRETDGDQLAPASRMIEPRV
jgi:hypothetical protein